MPICQVEPQKTVTDTFYKRELKNWMGRKVLFTYFLPEYIFYTGFPIS